MLFSAQHLSYRATAAFSKIAVDYVERAETLRPFYLFEPSIEDIRQAIEAKKNQPIDRALLVQVLTDQYTSVEAVESVSKNIQALAAPTTFTICTAHQPNLFTGPVYFIYKIIHAIKLAAELKKAFPENDFVPVYYMGSEDADKEELLHLNVQGKRYEWQTTQTGAVGRMTIDAALLQLIDELENQLKPFVHGTEFIAQLRACYTVGKTIQQATFEMVHGLFKKFGLVVLIPDEPRLKRTMHAVFEKDLFQQTPSDVVAETCTRLEAAYRIQAHPRDINLFYLTDGIRNRIVKEGSHFLVHDTALRFSEEEMRTELEQHPERFSPNVILRGLFQETILPNIAFIGGGGELAYWLQLKDLFQQFQIVFPVLLLRNSFLIIEKKWQQHITEWNVSMESLFWNQPDIMNSILQKQGTLPQLNGEVKQLETLYEDLKKLAGAVDETLQLHVEALKVRSLRQLQNLEKKMMRSERHKHESRNRQTQALKQTLFPGNGLQERVENLALFYAKWGAGFIDELLDQSLSLEQQFTVLSEV